MTGERVAARQAATGGVADGAPPDQGARTTIIADRAHNVAVVAGAGTGKTKTIIDRAVALLAPAADGAAIPIQRMALITFTRRAAGELRFRIREQLLREIEREVPAAAGQRAARLREALANLDAAFVGTIHGFADRLLRLRPVEAALSPAYALIDDTSELVSETFARLRRAAETGRLRAELGGAGAGLDASLVDEAAETLRAARRAGLQMHRAETAYGPVASVEALLARMIETRDIAVELCAPPDPGLEPLREAVRRFGEMVGGMRGNGFGHRQLRRMARACHRLLAIDDPAEAFRGLQEAYPGRALTKGRDFNDDGYAWSIYKAIDPQSNKPHSLADKLKGPHRWLAVRLVRLFPVAAAMYERVKAEHEVVDYLDLLIKLRNLLRDDRDAREFYQHLFDHLFVDEFQDTDPLQCEIVFYLCEQGALASTWEEAHLTPGKLTIVGDPKQSIYRFRRADIAMYDRATERLRAGGALEERLDTNFRSRPELIAFFNRQLAALLGKREGAAFDPSTGRANYEDLSAARTIPPAGVTVHVLPYADAADAGLLAPEGRALEAAMLARYLRWLLASGQPVRDPASGQPRAVQLGDIAVLACVTTNLTLLLSELDALGIAYAARGGALFLGHPLVRQYLLGLRALADRHDGIAEAALLRPPFFALDCADVVAAQLYKDRDADERVARVREARTIVAELRAHRHLQAPGATARDLIERTALGRAVVVGRNGAQTLAALYEVAAELDRRAAIDGLDYDGATEIVRRWARDPAFLDAPEPTGAAALRVMTIHAAKGLEFPVVILWDGFQVLSDRGGGTWCVARDGHAWALSLGGASVEYPRGGHLLEREKQFAEQERRRMYYVAATRARDVLVLPQPLTKSKTLQYATTVLAGAADDDTVRRFEVFRCEPLPPWAEGASPPSATPVRGDAASQERLEAVHGEFQRALGAATRPIATPTAVTTAAAATSTGVAAGADAESGAEEEGGALSERAHKVAAARFGPQFGSTVHRALELVLAGGSTGGVADAVELAAREAHLSEHLAEAEADVQRALATLRHLGVDGTAGATLASEYPLVMSGRDGRLLSGFIDLLVYGDDTVTVVDFKTDAPLPGPLAAAYPAYAAQLRLYGELLNAAGMVAGRRLRLGLLLTASGELRWLESAS